jgi:hypothetical protein
MAQAVARCLFSPPRCVSSPRRPGVRARATKPWVASSIDDANLTQSFSDESRASLARAVTNALFVSGGALEPHLFRLPTPGGPPPKSLLSIAASLTPHTAMRELLHPRRKRVPDVENALCYKCVLTPNSRKDHARRLRCRFTNEYIANLFEIAAAGTVGGTSVCSLSSGDYSSHENKTQKPTLSRFDLFHCHCFADANTKTVGLLFHALEYPAFNKDSFPHNLGFCQVGSTLGWDEGHAAVRTLLWCARGGETPVARFAALHTGDDDESNAGEGESNAGTPNPLKTLLVVPELHTTFEGDFGSVAGDFMYLAALTDRKRKHKVFAFPR